MRTFLFKSFIVIMVAAIAAAVAFFVVRNEHQSYTADAEILVDQPQITGAPSGNASISKILQLIPTYAQIATSSSIATEVADQLGDVSADDVRSSISASQVEKTQVLSIEVNNSDSDLAEKIASATANTLINRITENQKKLDPKPEDALVLSLIEQPNVHVNPTHKMRTVALAAVFGLIISAGAFLVMENQRRGSSNNS